MALDDAFCYAERRLGGTGILEDSTIEPKNTAGRDRPDLHPLMAQHHKKVFTGITWRELQAPPLPPPPQDEPMDPEAAPFLA